MRKRLPENLEAGRVRTGPLASDPAWGPYGKFYVPGPCGRVLTIVASGAQYADAQGWEHVSVSLPNRCPNWPEMCFVKDLFWDENEVVVQFHPAKNNYVNNHAFCLHLWKDTQEDFRLPPSELVGLKDRGVMSHDEAFSAWVETNAGRRA